MLLSGKTGGFSHRPFVSGRCWLSHTDISCLSDTVVSDGIIYLQCYLINSQRTIVYGYSSLKIFLESILGIYILVKLSIILLVYE